MVKLSHGAGSPTTGGCWMVACNIYSQAARVGWERAIAKHWNDHPDDVCPVIRHLAIRINDALPDDATRERVLGPWLCSPSGTRDDALVERRRWYVVDHAVRVWAPCALEAVGLRKQADALRSLAPVTPGTAFKATNAALAAKADAHATWEATAASFAADAAGFTDAYSAADYVASAADYAASAAGAAANAADGDDADDAADYAADYAADAAAYAADAADAANAANAANAAAHDVASLAANSAAFAAFADAGRAAGAAAHAYAYNAYSYTARTQFIAEHVLPVLLEMCSWSSLPEVDAERRAETERVLEQARVGQEGE